MKIRQDVADMLRAGHSDRAIARQLNTDAKRVSAARASLGLPTVRPGKNASASLEEAFRSHSIELSNGHVKWTGHITAGRGTFRWNGRHWTARRAAFEIQHGRPPEGNTVMVCDLPGCVAPAHVREIGGAAQVKDPNRPTTPATDEDIARMLLNGCSQSKVMRALPVSGRRVRVIREGLGLERHKPGQPAEPLEETFKWRATPTADGHLVWPTADLHIRTVDGASISAARYAFRQKYGRAPVGKVLPGCGTTRCVHPDHVEDRPMREALATQLASIFGGVR
ncbi:hypothetical protein [Streptomyces sp. NPDC013457]|uniref:hypothetical protein n=1 Tax=Streptomyces sp. NPDC013457 TaxID=3364866 RepID=UPI0036F8571E